MESENLQYASEVAAIGFNSLQTGRSMESQLNFATVSAAMLKKFQFPSNGKEHGKAYVFLGNPEPRERESFNSLQTGRSMESY